MNSTEPISPFSDKPLEECDNRECDAWIHRLRNPEFVNWDKKRGQIVKELGHLLVVPCYTNGECLAELLESELCPPGALRKYSDNVFAYERWYPPFGPLGELSRRDTPAAAVVEAIIRAAWEREIG